VNYIGSASRTGRWWRVCAGLGALALFAGPAAAQARVGVDVALERGSVHGGEFRHDLGSSLLLGRLDARVAQIAGSEIRAGIAVEQPFLQGDITTICILGSQGQCLAAPPEVRSVTATFGLRRTMAHRVALGLTAGAGQVANARWSDARLAFTGQFDLALRIGGPVYLTGGGRVVSWHDNGLSLHSYTQAYGIRIN